MRPTLRTISTRSVVAIRGDAMARSVKPTLDFYGSAAWKEVRLEVQRACKRTCQRCRKPDTRIYVDHIVELKDGGAPLERSNLIGLCAVCHGRKTADEKAKRSGRC
jgi:5-methylcytosine-specific restriction endonuclease McrA